MGLGLLEERQVLMEGEREGGRRREGSREGRRGEGRKEREGGDGGTK